MRAFQLATVRATSTVTNNQHTGETVRTLVMAGVLAAAFVGAAQAHNISITVDSFAEEFNGGLGVVGGSRILFDGRAFSLNLTPGVSQTALLDDGNTRSNNRAIGTIAGTATSNMTINGVTQSVSDDFTFITDTLAVVFSGGPAVVFDLGTFQVTVTPIDSADGNSIFPDIRQANFLETLTAAPEPASLSLFGIGLAGLGIVLRRRRNRAIGA